MTNLSELLPSGGGAKEFSAVASGTLTSGQTVALNVNGTVEAARTAPASLGTAVSPFGGNTGPSLCKLTDTTFLLTGRDSTSTPTSYTATTAIGTVTNGSITFGTKAQISAAGNAVETMQCFTLTDNKFVLIWKNPGSGNIGNAIVGEVSGGSISYGNGGTAVTFETGQMSLNICQAGVALTSSKFVIVYEDASNTSYGTAVACTVSATTITVGTPYVFQTSNSTKSSVVARLTDSKIVLAYSQTPNGSRGRVQVLTISGTTFTPGNAITYDSSSVIHHSIVAMSETQFVMSYIDGGSGNYGISTVCSVSGTTITIGVQTGFNLSSTKLFAPNSVKINDTQFAVSYSPVSPSTDRNVRIGTITAGTIVFDSAVTFSTGTDSNSVSGITLIGTSDVLLGSDPNATEFPVVDYKLESTNVSNFIGITSEAIANTATGKVNPQGGVATAQASGDGLVGTATEFTGGIPATDLKGVFTSTSNKVVYAFQNAGTGHGNAIVSNINASTNAITFGSAVSYNASSTSYNNIGFDANAQRIVAIYASAANSYAGDARVSSVSGTSLGGFGSVGTFTSGSDDYVSGDIVFDSNSNKMVIAFTRKDNSNNYYGTAVVGTVDPSNDTISFGSTTDFSSTNVSYINATFDSNSNKVVIAYRDNNNASHGTAIVGTVSGTTISFPNTATVFNSANTEMNAGKTICFDSNSNKVVIPFLSTTGKAIVGTVSGNTINFNGTATAFSGGDNSSQSSTFDSTLNKVIVQWRDNFNNSYGTASAGTVSGDNITFDTAVIVSTNQAVSAGSNSAVYDSNSNRTSLAQRIGNPTSSLVFIPSGVLEPLVTGSTYYVQNNGNLSTTSSTVTAGKAISTTQLVLKGAS